MSDEAEANTAPETTLAPAAEAPLAFDKAELVAGTEADSDPACTLCKRPLAREYFTLNEAQTCEDCHHLVTHQVKEAKGATAFFRAAGIGALAAVGGSIAWYAVAKITGMQIGLLAIAVGYIVGRAVRHGSKGFGGRRYQALAMVLTYVSITGSYVPTVLKTLDEPPPVTAHDPSRVTPATTSAAATAAPSSAAPAGTDGASDGGSAAPEKGLVHLVVLAVLVVGISLVAPFLAGASNILGIALIGIALYEAWKLNKPVPLVIGGPFRKKKPRAVADALPDALPGG